MKNNGNFVENRQGKEIEELQWFGNKIILSPYILFSICILDVYWNMRNKLF